MQDSSQTCQEVWIKKNAKEDLFDVPMGSYHGDEVCELIVLFLLNNSNQFLPKHNFELYRDDELLIIKKRSKRIIEKTKKKVFERVSLNKILKIRSNWTAVR